MPARIMMMPIAPDRADRASMGRALSIAQLLKCHLDVVFLRPDPEQAFFYTGVLPNAREELVADLREQMELHGQAAANRSQRIFADLRRKTGIGRGHKPDQAGQPSAGWRQLRGEAFTLVPCLAMGADLVLFTPETSKYSLLSENVLETTLLRAGRPVLYMPKEPSVSDWSRTLVAWDGSPSSARAISAWLASGLPVRRAVIAHVPEGLNDMPAVACVKNLLLWHGVEVEFHELPKSTDHAGQAFADAARALGCGLIVMGGYSHMRNWEAAFGGVTRYMIRHAPLPLLMMH